MAEQRFLEPLDVLFPRGNKLFGDAGSFGKAQMPPWPSAAAGAIRSRMLADSGVDFSAFARGEVIGNAALRDVLGTPQVPGFFRIGWFSIGRRINGVIEPLIALPADVVANEDSDAMRYLHPQPLPKGLRASCLTARVAMLRQEPGAKPEGGLWLASKGFAAYLRGETLSRKEHAVRTGDLWKTDVRIGIALDPQRRAAAERALFTVEAIATDESTGFLACIEGADGLVPKGGLLRLGGDGRGARIEVCKVAWPEPDWDRIARERRFRLVLVTPGLFERGWLPPGTQADGTTWSGPDGLSARLVCAAVPRAQVVSGWDLALEAPKAALRAAPGGSVYWFDAQGSDDAVLTIALRKLAGEGFGCLSDYPDRARLAEGFNNVMIANWANQ
ncbi:MAG: type III-B CRISPR module-associated protein Cmr3 [Acidobacteria bacterium]|nr:type III-B CRISPR module-associated protein Cmr3 [Acidobacteriota bacterium]